MNEEASQWIYRTYPSVYGAGHLVTTPFNKVLEFLIPLPKKSV